MEENKKSGGGDVRAEALSWDIEWEKAKNVFFGFLSLAPTVARGARHSHPSPPEKKVATRKKSRLRRKKNCACRKKWRIVCIKGGMSLPVVNCFFGCFPQPLDGRGGRVPIFRVLFGFGPKPGSFVVQKRNETPETLETLETLSVDVRIAVLSTFQRTWWQS